MSILALGITVRPGTFRYNPHKKTVAPVLAWSDIAAIRTSTEISHKTMAVLRCRKVLKVPRRSVAALPEAVRERCSLAT